MVVMVVAQVVYIRAGCLSPLQRKSNPCCEVLCKHYGRIGVLMIMQVMSRVEIDQTKVTHDEGQPSFT